MVKDSCYYEAKEKFTVFPSAYAGGYMAKCRKRKGQVNKTDKGLSLKRWYKEKWTDEYGNDCGSKKNLNTKKCRPTIRIDKNTPVTWKELSSDEKKKAVAEKKAVGMGKRAPSLKRSDRGVLETAPGDFRKTKPLYKPYRSTRSGKKGMVYVKDSSKKCGKGLIHFGDSSMSDYTKHKSPERRRNYRTRSAGIRDAEGNLTKDDKNSANYWSRKINW